MNIKSQKDFFSGLMFMCIGVAFAWGASAYTIGNGARMGPGYFPLALGVLLAVLGGIITFKALVVETMDGDKIGKFAWKPLFFIILANLVFGAMIGGLPRFNLPPMGLIIGIYALTFIASFAGDEFKFKEVAILATILAVLSYLAFIKLLNLQFPVWPLVFSR
ncbi:MAG: tripartite tricarboxylate transporter TctB family protein [Rhodoferax sp.]|nr:tripartite tricarboxylate transporter TctB family protein [Rhodoferax sp.]MCF8209706.1 tripartite tricarboxylate transporter TctB family protein [Rhodoferax sp.]